MAAPPVGRRDALRRVGRVRDPGALVRVGNGAMSAPVIDPRAPPWSDALADARRRMRPLFGQTRVANAAAAFLAAALAGGGRRTSWMLAAAAGDRGPWRQQALLGRDRWDSAALRDVVCAHVADHLGQPDGVLAIGTVAFPKQGRASCGVARQPVGVRRRVVNCQLAVFAAYVSSRGAALVDRALHLPSPWSDDPARCAAAGVPAQWPLAASAAALGAAMVERAAAAGLPFAAVVTDAELGAAVAAQARVVGRGALIAIAADAIVGAPAGRPHVAPHADAVVRSLPFVAWRRIANAADEAAWAACDLAPDATGIARRLLVRREGGEPAVWIGEGLAGWSLEDMAAAARRAQRLPDLLRLARADHGLDHNETRSWHGWHRHVGLVMMALAVRAAVAGDTIGVGGTGEIR